MKAGSGEFSEWTCEGGPKAFAAEHRNAIASSFRRNPTVKAGGICQYAVERAIIVNLGGTAEVFSDFCPFEGQKSFYFIKLLKMKG